MCMKYVNANIQCFDENPIAFIGNTGFSHMIDSVKAKQKNDKYIVGGFNIVVFINIRGTQKKDNPDNPLDSNKKMDFKIRLTKLNEDPGKQISYDLKEFNIDLSDKNIIHHGCFDYCERVEIINVEELMLNDSGAYVIKVLVKERDSEQYDVQMIHPLYVKE